MFSCFTDLGLPTTFSGYDLLDYASTRSLVPATSEHESETVLPRAAALSPAAPRASQSNGFLKSIRSFFAWCFSCWLPSAKPRAAAADRNGNAVGQSEPDNYDSQSDDKDLFKEFEHVRLHRLSVKNRSFPYDGEDAEDDAIEEAEKRPIDDLIDDLGNNASGNNDDDLSGKVGPAPYDSEDEEEDAIQEAEENRINNLIGDLVAIPLGNNDDDLLNTAVVREDGSNIVVGNSAAENDDYLSEDNCEFWKHFNNGAPSDPDDDDTSYSDSEDENS